MVYCFVAGWMFLLGIMVGRGDAPLSFDIAKFQKRLDTIVKKSGKKNREEINLDFYDALNAPDRKDEDTSIETAPKKIPNNNNTAIKQKTSLKKKTFKHYTIQIAAYSSYNETISQMAVLKAKGFSSYMAAGKKEGGNLYRIRIGSFATREEAEKFKIKLEKFKINSMVIMKDNSKKDSYEDLKG